MFYIYYKVSVWENIICDIIQVQFMGNIFLSTWKMIEQPVWFYLVDNEIK